MQLARFTCEPKNVGRSNATTAEEQADLEAEAKWVKQQKKKYYATVDEAKSATAIKPMLAKGWKEHHHKLKYPATGQPKLDGVRALASWRDGDVFLQSRGVGHAYRMTHVQEVLRRILPKNITLDGELYNHDITLQEINSLVKKPRYPESDIISYCVFDVALPDVPWEERMNWLYQFFAEKQPPWNVVWPVPSVSVDSPEAAKVLHDQFVVSGYEGAMIRNQLGTYRSGYRSPDLLKMKEFDDHEFEVVGWHLGKGKNENVPTFDCVTKDGKPFAATPKGTEAARLQMLAEANSSIGKMMKVRYMGWTNKGKPFHPVALGIREKQDM
jgi:ATP-dependent DNA ligase